MGLRGSAGQRQADGLPGQVQRRLQRHVRAEVSEGGDGVRLLLRPQARAAPGLVHEDIRLRVDPNWARGERDAVQRGFGVDVRQRAADVPHGPSGAPPPVRHVRGHGGDGEDPADQGVPALPRQGRRRAPVEHHHHELLHGLDEAPGRDRAADRQAGWVHVRPAGVEAPDLLHRRHEPAVHRNVRDAERDRPADPALRSPHHVRPGGPRVPEGGVRRAVPRRDEPDGGRFQHLRASAAALRDVQLPDAGGVGPADDLRVDLRRAPPGVQQQMLRALVDARRGDHHAAQDGPGPVPPICHQVYVQLEHAGAREHLPEHLLKHVRQLPGLDGAPPALGPRDGPGVLGPDADGDGGRSVPRHGPRVREEAVQGHGETDVRGAPRLHKFREQPGGPLPPHHGRAAPEDGPGRKAHRVQRVVRDDGLSPLRHGHVPRRPNRPDHRELRRKRDADRRRGQRQAEPVPARVLHRRVRGEADPGDGQLLDRRLQGVPPVHLHRRHRQEQPGRLPHDGRPDRHRGDARLHQRHPLLGLDPRPLPQGGHGRHLRRPPGPGEDRGGAG
mmetsp:Transcript_19851/g.26947  ORF Transcript_19851/g.26947 Transcript_19851/m.26947 type:complete len:557 (+) Transcript_19851:340-2010(+)